MSAPLIRFRHGIFLHELIFKTSYPYKKLDSYLKQFDKFFREYETTIIDSISSITGLKWNMKQIDVYLFDSNFPSISFPLCLNYHGGYKDFSLFCLIHELVHNILFYNMEAFGNVHMTAVELEAVCEFVTKNVCKKFFDDETIKRLAKSHEFDGYYRCVWERGKELEASIGNKTVIEFYTEKVETNE